VGRADLDHRSGASAGEGAVLGDRGTGDIPPPGAGDALGDGGDDAGALPGGAAQPAQCLLVGIEVGQIIDIQVHAVTDLPGPVGVACARPGEFVPGVYSDDLNDHQGVL